MSSKTNREESNKYKILLIGSTGKIGRSVLSELIIQDRFELGLLLRDLKSFDNTNNLKLFEGDILSSTLSPAIEWADIVINCSGIVSYKKNDADKIQLVNVEGVKNIVNDCLAFNRRLIHTSSAIAYGSSTDPIEFSEDDDPVNVFRGEYSKSKYQADQIVINSGLSYIILRPSTLISTLKNLYGFYKKGFIADLPGGASFALMDEVAKAYIPAVDLIIKSPSRSIFNLGGNNLRFNDVFDFFKKVDNRKTRFINIYIIRALSIINDYILLPVFKKSLITRESFITGSHYTYLNSDKAKHILNYTISPFEVSLRKNLL